MEEVICTSKDSTEVIIISDLENGIAGESPDEESGAGIIATLDIPKGNNESHNHLHNNNNNVRTTGSPSRASSPSSTGCTKCQKTETESQMTIAQQKSHFETEMSRVSF